MPPDRSSPLEDTTRIAPAPEAAEGDQAAYLLVLAGSNVGAMYKIEQERLVMGRGDRVDIRMVDEGLSREHARLLKESGRFVLEDLGSTNGTYLGQRKLDGPVPLEIGVPLRIGKTVLELR